MNFLKDGSKSKRGKKIDELIGSELYMDYWTRVSTNWLVGREKLNGERHIGLLSCERSALTTNTPYVSLLARL